MISYLFSINSSTNIKGQVTFSDTALTAELKQYLYPFGMQMPGRIYSGETAYRYGFQGQETDKEWLGGAVSYKYRVHDARIGRFLSVDPLTKKYPYLTPYQFSSNQPIHAPELEGLESADELSPQKPDWVEQEQKKWDTLDDNPSVLEYLGEALSALFEDLLFKDEYEAQNLPEEERGVLPFEGREPNEIRGADAIGIQVGGDFIAGGGASQTVQFLFVKDYGFVVIGNTGGGVGWDVSAGAQVVVAWTAEEKPDFEDFTGTGFQATGGFSFATATYFADYEQASKRIGANTEGIAFGLAVGVDDLSTQFTGSTQLVKGYVITGATYPDVKNK
jgi:RHS repeat-associated protein